MSTQRKKVHTYRNYRIFSLLSPSNKSTTLPFENGKDITCIAISPDDGLILTVDEGMMSYISNKC